MLISYSLNLWDSNRGDFEFFTPCFLILLCPGKDITCNSLFSLFPWQNEWILPPACCPSALDSLRHVNYTHTLCISKPEVRLRILWQWQQSLFIKGNINSILCSWKGGLEIWFPVLGSISKMRKSLTFTVLLIFHNIYCAIGKEGKK